MLYQRIAATAAVFLLLGGCSFFGFRDQHETPTELSKIDSHGPDGPLEGAQSTALSGYLSDQEVAASRIAANRGFVGGSSVGPTSAVQARPIERVLSFKNLPPPRRQALDLQPMTTAFEPGRHSLADLIADRDWRKRTSETLNRLFQ